MNYPQSLRNLMDSFKNLPGIGEKTAERLAFSVLQMDKEKVDKFSTSLLDVKEKIKKCSICHHLTEDDVCPICKDRIIVKREKV